MGSWYVVAGNTVIYLVIAPFCRWEQFTNKCFINMSFALHKFSAGALLDQVCTLAAPVIVLCAGLLQDDNEVLLMFVRCLCCRCMYLAALFWLCTSCAWFPGLVLFRHACQFCPHLKQRHKSNLRGQQEMCGFHN